MEKENAKIKKLKVLLVEGAKNLASRDTSIGLPFNICDEIVQNCYLGDSKAACNIKLLEQLDVTSVLNASQGNLPSQVNTNQEYYKDANIKFLGFNLMDDVNVDIGEHFEEAAKFIHDSIDNPTNPGKVLVHCYQGISRSATLVLAYLMIYHEMSLEDAIKLCSSKRYIYPNDNFLAQLILLENRLEKSGRNTEAAN